MMTFCKGCSRCNVTADIKLCRIERTQQEEKVFVKHYVPNHMPEPKIQWSILKIFTKIIQKLMSQTTYYYKPDNQVSSY